MAYLGRNFFCKPFLDPQPKQPIVVGQELGIEISQMKDKLDTRKPIDIPFNLVGTLPPNAPSYIPRNCDSELYKKIGSQRFISIIGDFQTGKSSLLTMVHSNPPTNWQTCFIDFQLINTNSSKNLDKEIFEEITIQLNKKVNSWREVKNFSINNKVVFLFDEIAKIKPQRFHQIMGGIFAAIQNSTNISVVSASLKPLKELFWLNTDTKSNNTNNKYCSNWYTIRIDPFTDEQIDKLMSLLPEIVKNTCNTYIETIKEHSKCHPQKLQTLFYKLVDEFNNLETTEETLKSKIELLINTQTSYEQ